MPPRATIRLVTHLSRCRWVLGVETDWAVSGGEKVLVPFRPKVLPAGQSVPSGTILRGSVDVNRPKQQFPSWRGVRRSLHPECSVAVKARLTSAGLEGYHAEAVASAQCRPRDETLRRKRDPDRQQVWASSNRLTWPPEQLRTLGTLSRAMTTEGRTSAPYRA